MHSRWVWQHSIYIVKLTSRAYIFSLSVCMLYVVCLTTFCVCVNVLLLPFTKVEIHIDLLQIDSLGKNCENSLSLKLKFLHSNG